MPDQFLIFILILTNAGGEGKTTLALLVRAIFDLADISSYALDADQGNWALKNQYGEDVGTDVIPWNTDATAAERIVAKAALKPVTMDAGANMLVAYSPIADLVAELQKHFSASGYRTAVLFPLSPNKSGGAGGLNRLVDKVEHFEKYVVLNHRDRSRHFGAIRSDYPQLHVGHLYSGLQSYLSDRQWQIAHVVLNPEQGYGKAVAHIGDWIRKFAQDPVVRELLTADLCDKAIGRLPQAPPALRFALDTVGDVTDEKIMHNEHRSWIMKSIDENGWSSAGLQTVADRLEAHGY